jgi:carboxymethylenebutenolidase
VVQEAFGVNDHIEDVTRRFAEEGYLAVAPHLFHRLGDPKYGYDVDLKEVFGLLGRLEGEEILDDVDAALAELERAGIPEGRRFVVGFCMGGTVAFMVAARRPIGAAVSFYGGGVAEGRFGWSPLIEEAANLRAPWLGLYGDEDASIPVEQVEQLGKVTAEAEPETEIVRYPDAGHGFHCDARESYHEASARDGWSRTLAWFDAHSA